MGITESMYYPIALAMMARHYPEVVRSRALGIHQSAQLCDVMAGGWYGGWAADNVVGILDGCAGGHRLQRHPQVWGAWVGYAKAKLLVSIRMMIWMMSWLLSARFPCC